MMDKPILFGLTVFDGFHPTEIDLLGPFRWTEVEFSVQMNAPARFLLLHMCYYGDCGELRIRCSEGPRKVLEVRRGWQTYCVDLGLVARGILNFEINPLVSVAEDPRELGLMVRRMERFNCPHRFEALNKQIRNAILNERELREGMTVLQSVPPRLRISVETKCNIYPRCVYCEWDWAKTQEAGAEIDFSLETMDSLGKFYTHATEIVDCSYGEPFLNRNLKKLLEAFDQTGKHFEMTSNGQIMNTDKQDLLLGKNLILYVSLDAASRESYRRYRNDKFDTLVKNLGRLCEAKKRHGNLPTVIVSFIAMKSNIKEFPDFMELVKGLGVDAVKLRSLYHEGAMIEEQVNRAGYTFKYHDEVVDLDTLRQFASSAREVAERKGLRLLVDIDDFQKTALESDRPLCSEPWETIYVLNRGIMPCCFGKKPLATLDGVVREKLGEYVAHVFNGEKYQALRKGLAAGNLPEYCQESKSCPIVRKMTALGIPK